MKNILFFLSILLFAACSKKTETTPEVIPNPTLNLTLSADSIRPGDSVVLTCSTENAVRTSNNFGAPTTTQWTHTLVPTQTTTLEVAAYNTLEKSVSKTKTVIYLPWTKTDTISNRDWKLGQIKGFSTSMNSWYTINLTQEQLEDIYKFHPNGLGEAFHTNGVLFGSYQWQWITVNSVSMIQIGSEKSEYVLTDTKLILTQRYDNGDIYEVTQWRNPRN